MAALNVQKTVGLGILLLIAALLTIALGVSSIAIHKWSQAGAAATFAGAILVFAGALAIHVSKTRTRLRVCLLLGSTVVACLSTVVMLCVCALSIRKDCDDRQLVMKNPAATDANRTLATCIVVIDVLILLVGIVDLVSGLVLAYTCWTALEQMAKISALMILEPVEKANGCERPNGGEIGSLENGIVHHDGQSDETKLEIDKSIYVKTHYCNKCNENLSSSVLALHVDENFDETKTKKEKKAKAPKEKKEKEKKKKLSITMNQEEMEAAESINMAVANHDLDHMETSQVLETEKTETQERPEVPNYDLPDQAASPESGEPRELYTTEEDVTRYNPVFNPTVVPEPDVPDGTTVGADTVVVQDETQPLTVEVDPGEISTPVITEPVQSEVVEAEVVAPEVVEPKVLAPEVVSPIESLPLPPTDAVAPDLPNTHIEADVHMPENDAETAITMATEDVIPPETTETPETPEILPAIEPDRQSLDSVNSVKSVTFDATPTIIADDAVNDQNPENTVDSPDINVKTLENTGDSPDINVKTLENTAEPDTENLEAETNNKINESLNDNTPVSDNTPDENNMDDILNKGTERAKTEPENNNNGTVELSAPVETADTGSKSCGLG